MKLLVPLLLVLGLCVTGCQTVAQNAALIQVAGQGAGYVACTQANNPAEIALLRTDLTVVVIPALQNSPTTMTAAQAEAILFAHLAKHLGPQYQLLLQMGLTELGAF